MRSDDREKRETDLTAGPGSLPGRFLHLALSLAPCLTLSLALCAFSPVAQAQTVQAQTVQNVPQPPIRIYCPLPEDGIWINREAKAKEIARLEVESRCEDNQVFTRVRAFTSCIPRDCKWGWTKAEIREGGGLRVMLVGFLSAKLLEIRAFGDILDVYVTDIAHDPSIPNNSQAFNLRRK